MLMLSLEGPARAQSGAEPAITIPVHRGTSTIFFLPDEVLGMRLTADVAGLMAATYYDDKVIVRPLRGVPVGDMLLGLEFQVRQGVPADYRSVSVLLSWGCFLDQGE